MTRWFFLSALLLALSGATQAHPLAPAFLQLHEGPSNHYQVVWRTSATRVRSIDVTPVLPEDCLETSPAQVTAAENESITAKWTIQCDHGLANQTVRIAGLENSSINVILRIEPLQGETIKALLGPEQATFIIPSIERSRSVFWSYLQLGAEHLLTGFDHLLFILGLLLLVPSVRRLVVTVTAFTLGHSITLTLATLNWVQVPQAWAEWAIAVTILVLACEVARSDADERSWIRQRPWLMATSFGLIHGLGFAGALREVGLPQDDIPLSLFAFNLGIEIGQLLLILATLSFVYVGRRYAHAMVNKIQSPLRWGAIYLIGTLAAYWCFDRLSSLVV